MRNLFAAFVLASVASPFGWADDVAPIAAPSVDVFRLSGYGENDSRGLKPNNATDRYYTNGIAFALATRGAFATSATQWLPFDDDFDDQHRAVGLTTGQLMFTPDDIEERDLIPDDHPYAGYLYGGVFFQRSNAHTLDHVQIDLGIVGPSSLAGDAQVEVHHIFGGIEPRGWDNQLKDEATGQFTLRKKWRTGICTLNLNDVPPIEVQLIPQVELAAGSIYRHIGGGALLRVGFNLPDDFGPDRLSDIASFTALPKRSGGGYLFVRLAGRAVDYNIFLDGNNRKDSHHVDSETLVGEIEFGIALQFRFEAGSLDIAYSQVFRSDEFEGQDGSHSFGSISATWVFRF